MEGKITINNGDVITANIKPVEPTIYFKGENNIEIMRLEPNGDIYVSDRLVENDREVVEGLREFLSNHGY